MNTSVNLFVYKIHVNETSIRRSLKATLYMVLLICVMLAGILTYPVISQQFSYQAIRNTGMIGEVVPISYASEARGVFIHCASWNTPPNWELIAQTCKDNGIQAIYGEFAHINGGYWNSSLFENPFGDQLNQAIIACHAKGIEVHVAMDVISYPLNDAYKAEYPGGALSYWGCPNKLRPWIKALVEDFTTRYPIDGFMFDYTRYDEADVCYCSQCRAQFEAWLGEGPINDWTPFYPNGQRHLEYLEWRSIPINELVRDMRSWMLAIRPNLKFSAAVFTLFDDVPVYWRKFIGQDTAYWIKEGYLDAVAPMTYTDELDELENYIRTSKRYFTGVLDNKTSGIIPYFAFICTGFPYYFYPPEHFKTIVDKVRSLGVDGWVIWRYGGPGVDPSIAPDIRDYLSIISMPEVFKLYNLQVSVSQTSATISWISDLPASSKVEYSTNSLFNTSAFKVWGDFHYWDIEYIGGVIAENSTLTTMHKVTLTNLSPATTYYFRIQSERLGLKATSKIFSFTTL